MKLEMYAFIFVSIYIFKYTYISHVFLHDFFQVNLGIP